MDDTSLSLIDRLGRPSDNESWHRLVESYSPLLRGWLARQEVQAARDDNGLNQRLQELEDAASQLSQIWDREHQQYVVRKLLELIEPRFEPTTNQVFRRLVLDGLEADQVAAELGLSLGAVFTTKSRVLRELRRLGRGMLDREALRKAPSPPVFWGEGWSAHQSASPSGRARWGRGRTVGWIVVLARQSASPSGRARWGRESN